MSKAILNWFPEDITDAASKNAKLDTIFAELQTLEGTSFRFLAVEDGAPARVEVTWNSVTNLDVDRGMGFIRNMGIEYGYANVVEFIN